MPDLPEALNAALTARYMVGEVKSPVTTKRGLAARVAALERKFTHKGDRKGASTKRIAAELGISPRTWQRWKSGASRPNAALIEQRHRDLVIRPRVRARLRKNPPPNSVTVTAKINWNGYYNHKDHGHRSTTLGSMRGVLRHVIRAWFDGDHQAAADKFEQGAAQANSTPYVKFEGDNVEIDFPWE